LQLLPRSHSIIILLIDQFEQDRTKLRRYLTSQERSPVTIFEAIGANQGIALAKIVRPHCIVFELKQEDMVGMEALSLLKAATNDLPASLIVWTRLNGDMLRTGAAMLGVELYFAKSAGSEVAVGQAILSLLGDAGGQACK
jgi:DNA-binding NarL/FixJ family response regulator